METDSYPIPLSIRALLALFEDDLKDVAFPDVDRASLTGLVAAVETQAEAVESARNALQAALEDRDAALEALVKRAHKGHAYARIYADGDPELLEKLNAISFETKGSKSNRSVQKSNGKEGRKRGRKPKTTSGPELPLHEPVVEMVPEAI